MIALLLMLLAQEPTAKVICTSVNGPIPIGKEVVNIPMKCCPEGKWLADPNHPTTKNGDLICTDHEEKT